MASFPLLILLPQTYSLLDSYIFIFLYFFFFLLTFCSLLWGRTHPTATGPSELQSITPSHTSVGMKEKKV